MTEIGDTVRLRTATGSDTEVVGVPSGVDGLVIIPSTDGDGSYDLLHFETGSMVLGWFRTVGEANAAAEQIADWFPWAEPSAGSSASSRTELRDRLLAGFPQNTRVSHPVQPVSIARNRMEGRILP